MPLINTLQKNLADLLRDAIGYSYDTPCIILFDQKTPLAQLLFNAYHAQIPRAQAIHFDTVSAEQILKQINLLPKNALVILIQSSSFRLNEFRFRLELFKLGLQVIEHAHLNRIQEQELSTYIESLAYEKDYYQKVGPALKTKIDQCQGIRLIGSQSELIYHSAFEDSKLNIGDYRSLKNVGGQFPIGEVFSEPKDLTGVNGTLELFAFGDKNFAVQVPETPFQLVVEKGTIVSHLRAPSEFQDILKEIEQTEKKIWIRELGFGLNRAFSKTRRVSDIGAYERMCGIHLSVGAKHAMYRKEGFPKKQCKFHVDVFADVQKVLIDHQVVFADGRYLV